jgi:hypothetical protein
LKTLKTLNFSEFKIAIEQRKKIALKLKELEAPTCNCQII